MKPTRIDTKNKYFYFKTFDPFFYINLISLINCNSLVTFSSKQPNNKDRNVGNQSLSAFFLTISKKLNINNL